MTEIDKFNCSRGLSCSEEMSVFNLCSLLCNTEQETRLGTFSWASRHTSYMIVSVSFSGYVPFCCSTVSLKVPCGPLKDLCFICSSELEFLCFYHDNHFCHGPKVIHGQTPPRFSKLEKHSTPKHNGQKLRKY